MTAEELAARTGAKLLHPGLATRPIERVYAGDRMSDLLNHASDTTLVVTNLATSQLVRAAALMDLAGLCLVNDVAPEAALLEAAASSRTALMVSPLDLFATCGRLYECFCTERQAVR